MGTGIDVTIREATEQCDGDDGELQVRGAAMFSGYWNRPDADAAMREDGRP